MFSGIIECIGRVEERRADGGNLHVTISAPFVNELKVDQSIAHNGACLTVVAKSGSSYTVTAIAETLSKTNLRNLKVGDQINLERCVKLGDRLDGHMVQGHVDGMGKVTRREERDGSTVFHISYKIPGMVTVPKGSICVNGVSLTVVDSDDDLFTVHLIPYTLEHTNLGTVKEGQEVNLEFDILGKYIEALLKKQH